jgi:hypothetical protein
LTEFLADIPDNKSTKIDDCFFSDKLDFIERQTILVIHSDDLAKSDSVAFFTAFLNASLIYLYEELRECPKWNNISICLSQRSKSFAKKLNSGSVRECGEQDMLCFGTQQNSSLLSHLKSKADIRFLTVYSGLQMADLSSVAKHCPDLLLWTLLLGRAGNSPLEDISRVWFRKGVAAIARNFGVEVPPSAVGLKYFELAEILRDRGQREDEAG